MKIKLPQSEIAVYKEMALRIAFEHLFINDMQQTLQDANDIFRWLVKDDSVDDEIHTN